jgi:DNA-directed RNA polymerase specialized sigma24 family protein
MRTPTTKPRVALIDQMAAEWKSIGRSRTAVRSLQDVARHDPALSLLVLGPGPGAVPPPCPTPCDLIEHMRHATGRAQRDEAARLVRVLLREADADPFICRMLVQALVPGLVTVAGKLQWGRGGEWQDGEEFFGELLATTWLVLQEWSGQDRPYAVLDLLSAIRCRLRRQLFRSKDLDSRSAPLGSDLADAESTAGSSRRETDLEELARILIDQHREGMRPDEVQVLYAHHVLGYSIAELSALTGRDRRALYARRDRGQRRLCA